MAAHHHVRAGDRPPNAETCREVVRRVLASRHFERSVRMREFLAYVSERALDGRSDEIHEQEIGCAVFGRAANYDTGQDNIVRVNASQVRRKLELYFASEGTAEPVVFEIPPGSYVPVFRERGSLRSAAAESQPDAGERKTKRRIAWLLPAISAILLLFSIGLALALRQQRLQAAADFEKDPVLDALWSQLLRKDLPTDIVVADASFDLLEDLTGQSASLNDYLHPDLWRQAGTLASKPDAQAAAKLAGARRYTSLADVNLTRRIVALAGPLQSRIAVYFARDLSTRQMKSDNLILLGSKRANPWVELIENRMNFRFGRDGAPSSFFKNLAPLPGEAQVYRNDEHVSYCDVAFLPNLAGTGNILAISGTEMVGTDVGGEFLTDPRAISVLTRVVPLQPNGKLPYFEILLRAGKIGGSSPGFQILAHRLPRL